MSLSSTAYLVKPIGDAKMTSNYEYSNLNQQSHLNDQKADNTELDCFELLSAYLDGEVSVEERQQVQDWLDNDPEIKKIYIQLSRLHHGIHNIPVPTTETSSTHLSNQVFQSIDRTQRKRKTFLWGGGAIAAVVLATFSNLFTGGSNIPTFRLAESSNQENASQPIMVAVAVNKPAVKIPKAAVSSTQKKLPKAINNY